MAIKLDALEITHNTSENRFETLIEGNLAKLDYIYDGDTIVMTHVGVHPDQRGLGIAGKITQFALEYAKEKKLRVIPMCPYIAAYIRRNPQYAPLTKLQPQA